MKKLPIFSLIIILLSASPLLAQELPMPSPSSMLKQRVGLTDITIKYSRPSMKDRVIFGDLLPFDEMWRAGANKCTRISFSNPVFFGEKKVDAGAYSVFFIPSPNEWVFILNSDTNLRGTSGYDTLKDVLRMNVIAMPVPEKRESMLFNIGKLRDQSAALEMEWDEVKVSISFFVNDMDQAMKNIKKAIKEQKEGEYRAYMNAASFLSRSGQNEQALEYIDDAIKIGDYWYAHWIKAQILGDMKQYDKAMQSVDAAVTKGQAHYADLGRDFTYIETISKKAKEWENK